MAIVNVKTSDRFQAWVGKTNQIATGFGDLDNLPTGSASVVAGINAADAAVGDITTLETTDQTSIVAALAEVKRIAIVMALTLASPVN